MRWLAQPATWFFLYLAVVMTCLGSLAVNDELSLGRNPWRNLVKTAGEMSHPSFFDIWFGETEFQYKNSEGEVLRTENRRDVESSFIAALFRAIWVTVKIATIGSFLGSLFAFPVGALAAKNVGSPAVVTFVARTSLDMSRSVHTLIFGLLFVGIFGLGPMAGILAIAAHSFGSFGKLYAETIENMDRGPLEAVRSVGATETQVFFKAVLPTILPQVISINFYLWEFNIRDSTVLGMIGAGGLGLLISEATSLFQWGRLSTILLAIICLVYVFDFVSRRVRSSLI